MDTRASKFSFPKIAGTFKNEYFLENFKIPSFCINEHLLKRKFEITKKKYFRPQKWAKWLLTRTREKRGFLNFLAVKQRRETHFVSGPALKNAYFRVTVKIFRGLAPNQKATFQSEIL